MTFETQVAKPLRVRLLGDHADQLAVAGDEDELHPELPEDVVHLSVTLETENLFVETALWLKQQNGKRET